jgi:tripartite-type tricarboxylate transporter receptor subunit TctC
MMATLDAVAPSRRAVLSLLAGWGASLACPAAANDIFPSRPVRLVVPAPPGGITDTVARLLADTMSSDLGQPLIVDNRAGAAGVLGTQAVADAAPDGYTVLVTSLSNHVLAPLTQKPARLDPQRDLDPVGLVLRSVGLFAIPASLPAHSLADFIALARARPGQLNYGSSGIGSANHVQTERFKTLCGIELLHVPYRGGAPLIQALAAGEVHLALLDYASAEGQLQAGRVRALAQSGVRRHPALAGVPTFSEAGFPAYDPSFWIGLAVPRGTPSAVVRRLNGALVGALGRTEVRARAQAFGWSLADGSAQEMSEAARRDLDVFRTEVARLNLDRQ